MMNLRSGTRAWQLAQPDLPPAPARSCLSEPLGPSNTLHPLLSLFPGEIMISTGQLCLQTYGLIR